MGLNASKVEAPKSNKTFKTIEAGNYMGRLVHVIDLGVQEQQPYKGQEKPPVQKIRLTYELANEFLEDEDGNPMEDKPLHVSEDMPLYSLSAENAKSTKRVKALDPSNKLQGDLSKMIGTAVTITIVHNKSKKDPEKVYANIGNVTPAMKGVPVPELIQEPKVFDLDAPDLEVFGSLPEWVQDIIKGNLNFPGSKLAELLGDSSEAPEEEQADEEYEDDDIYDDA